MTQDSHDKLFSKPIKNITDFKFDESVAPIFSDMINRSVPGYAQIIDLISTITKQFAKKDHRYYDLGCSLGASMLAMGQSLHHQNATVIGVDNSPAMLAKAKSTVSTVKQKNNSDVDYQLVCTDINDITIQRAAMVVMNFTLQFIAIEQRDSLIQKIYDGLTNNGALIISEKVKLETYNEQELICAIHHQFKADQGYSQLEISQKRDAIENVLLPETLAAHITRLKQAGFSIVTPWFQNFQFISLLAVK